MSIEAKLREIGEILKEQGVLTMPDWAKFVKTSVARERPPMQNDWWYLRGASILRKLYLYGHLGVRRLSKFYGGRQNRGYKPEKKRKGSKKILRVILQQLENGGLVKKVETPKKGRILTEKGKEIVEKYFGYGK